MDLLKDKSENNYKIGAAKFQDFDNSAIGFGWNYKYVFNINNFFIAPGVFAEKIGTEATEVDGFYFYKVSIYYRYGLKADIVYDINDSFAVYVSGGLSNTRTRSWEKIW